MPNSTKAYTEGGFFTDTTERRRKPLVAKPTSLPDPSQKHTKVSQRGSGDSHLASSTASVHAPVTYGNTLASRLRQLEESDERQPPPLPMTPTERSDDRKYLLQGIFARLDKDSNSNPPARNNPRNTDTAETEQMSDTKGKEPIERFLAESGPYGPYNMKKKSW